MEHSEWLQSPEGLEWSDGVYNDGFDEGWENAVAMLKGMELPDEIIPTMSDDEIWKVFQHE